MFEAGSGKGSDRRDSRNNPVDVRARAENTSKLPHKRGHLHNILSIKAG